MTRLSPFRIVLLTGGILLGLAAGISYRWYHRYDPVRVQFWEAKARPRIQASDEAAHTAIARQADEINAFFEQRKRNTRAFAQEVLSLSGKWNFLVSKMPWSDDNRHRQYLQQKFQEIIFSPDDLQAVLSGAIAGYVSNAESLEGQLLVELRQDLADAALTAGQPDLVPQSLEAFRQEYERMVQAVLPLLKRDLGVAVGSGVVNVVGSEIVSLIALRVTTACATRLGISAGVLGTGAGSAAFTLGAGLVIGFAIDYALNAFLRYRGYDPESQIAGELDKTLDNIRALIVDGDAATHQRYQELRKQPSRWFISSRDDAAKEADGIEQSGTLGLRFELEKLHAARARIRQAALHKLIVERGN